MCHLGHYICWDIESGIWLPDVDALYHWGANWVYIALTELFDDVINEQGLAELDSVWLAVVGNDNAEGEFCVSQVQDISMWVKVSFKWLVFFIWWGDTYDVINVYGKDCGASRCFAAIDTPFV